MKDDTCHYKKDYGVKCYPECITGITEDKTELIIFDEDEDFYLKWILNFVVNVVLRFLLEITLVMQYVINAGMRKNETSWFIRFWCNDL